MASFQRNLMLLAGIFLLLIFAFMGYKIYKSKSQIAWPPMVGDCPDYWTDLSGNGSKCVNAHALGTCNIPTSIYSLNRGKNVIGHSLLEQSNVSLNTCQANCTDNQNCFGLVYRNSDRFCSLKNRDISGAILLPDSATNLYLKNENGLTNFQNFNQAPFLGTGGTCAKYNWAHNCGVTWDGITSGIPNPCSTSTTQ